MHFDEYFIDNLKNTANLVDIIGEKIELKKRGNSYLAICPFHNDTKPSLHVHEQKQIYKCFACNASGNVFKFLMNYENISFPEAVTFLSKKYNIELPNQKYSLEKQSSTPLYQINRESLDLYHYFLTKHKEADIARNYLKTRNLWNKSLIEKYKIGYAPHYNLLNIFIQKREFQLQKDEDAQTRKDRLKEKKKLLLEMGLFNQYNDVIRDFFRKRVLFPILDEQFRCVGFGGRAIDENTQPKYLNTKETVLFKKDSILYGLCYLTKERRNLTKIYIVEGYLDVIACQLNGIYAVAPLGTALTQIHAKKIKRYVESVCLLFDGDAAGKQAAIRSLNIILPLKLEVQVVLLPSQMDPFDFFQRYSSKDFHHFVEKNQERGEDFLINSLMKENMTILEKEKLVLNMIDLLRKMSGIAKEAIKKKNLKQTQYISKHN